MSEKWVTSVDGSLQLIDQDTGEVKAVQKVKPGKKRAFRGTSRGPNKPATAANETHHWVRAPNGKRMWVPKGTNVDDIPRTIYPYNETTRDQILLHVTEGMSLKKVGELEDMPPFHVIWKWLREIPEFKGLMDEARRARAEYYADKVIAIAEQEAIHPDDVAGERLKKDVYQWGAEVGDPGTYGKRTKVVGDASAPLQILVNTGIQRAGDTPPPLDVPSTVEDA